MAIWDRQLWRFAVRLEEAYRANEARPSHQPLPETCWQDARQQLQRLAIAESCGWRHAANCERQSVVTELEHIGHSLRELATALGNTRQRAAPTIRMLYEELVAISGDFEDLKTDDNALSVTTEPLELEGIQLGRFMIRLELDELGSTTPYAVVALDPNPAASSSDTTHPHVSDDTLCAGEGRRPIAAAIEEGRLHDFFTIVDRILHTYAAGAAYVELDRWHGVPCHDCDGVADEEETYTCHSCEETLCGECLVCCGCCCSGFCSSCIQHCQQCEERCCDGCLTRCPRCRREMCRSCLADELCTDCSEELKDEAEETSNENPLDVTVAAAST
jgi:hypothetical protein